ncbi:hypothetical protein IMSAG049_00674 [Clostridiales bacterium]|nr:hypothetical protein IMSAG049_00674 [Clostridiales bacterium]
MENILISACLLGVSCRYDGKSKPDEKIIGLKKKYNLIPVCPEIMGGLPTPRLPVEICNGRALTETGADVTEQFEKGASETMGLAEIFECKMAVLKTNSPSCGFGSIYDGTFSKTLTEGNGFTADLLFKNGIKVFGENIIDSF